MPSWQVTIIAIGGLVSLIAVLTNLARVAALWHRLKSIEDDVADFVAAARAAKAADEAAAERRRAAEDAAVQRRTNEAIEDARWKAGMAATLDQIRGDVTGVRASMNTALDRILGEVDRMRTRVDEFDRWRSHQSGAMAAHNSADTSPTPRRKG